MVRLLSLFLLLFPLYVYGERVAKAPICLPQSTEIYLEVAGKKTSDAPPVIHPEKPFAATIVVVNATRQDCRLMTISCNWEQNWEFYSPQVDLTEHGKPRCPANVEQDILVYAGKAYSREVYMVAIRGAAAGKITFGGKFRFRGLPDSYPSEIDVKPIPIDPITVIVQH